MVSQSSNEHILNDFYDEMVIVTADRLYMVGPGNHEANCDNCGTTNKAENITYAVSICVPGQTNFTGYINHFRMPSSESDGLGNFWYSFDHGMVRSRLGALGPRPCIRTECAHCQLLMLIRQG